MRRVITKLKPEGVLYTGHAESLAQASACRWPLWPLPSTAMSSSAAALPSQTIGWHASSSPVISLLPGELYFGQRHLLKTLLGSCVAITLWHPQRQLGGMCHFLLPTACAAPGRSSTAATATRPC